MRFKHQNSWLTGLVDVGILLRGYMVPESVWGVVLSLTVKLRNQQRRTAHQPNHPLPLTPKKNPCLLFSVPYTLQKRPSKMPAFWTAEYLSIHVFSHSLGWSSLACLVYIEIPHIGMMTIILLHQIESSTQKSTVLQIRFLSATAEMKPYQVLSRCEHPARFFFRISQALPTDT